MSHNLIVISGPSGSGKSTLVKRLVKNQKQASFLVSHTTRPRRESEVEGKDYYFIEHEVFLSKIDNHEFIEWAQVHNHLYGTSTQELERSRVDGKFLILDIDVQGAGILKRKVKDAVFIFVVPPSMEELKKRLIKRERGMDGNIALRLKIAKEEIKHYNMYDFVIDNTEIKEAYSILESIFISNQNRVCFRESLLKRLLDES